MYTIVVLLRGREANVIWTTAVQFQDVIRSGHKIQTHPLCLATCFLRTATKIPQTCTSGLVRRTA